MSVNHFVIMKSFFKKFWVINVKGINQFIDSIGD